MRFRSFFFILCVLILAACQSKTPTCSSNKAIELVKDGIAEELIEIGVANYKKDELSRSILIESIKTVSIDERLDSYVCNGNLLMNYPIGLADNIYRSYSTEKGRDNILIKLKKKYGEIPGFLIHGQMIAILSISTIGAVFNRMLLPNNEDNDASLKEMLKIFLEDKIPISYEVFSIQNNKDASFQVKWQFDDSKYLNVIEIFLNVSSVYEQESA